MAMCMLVLGLIKPVFAFVLQPVLSNVLHVISNDENNSVLLSSL